MNNTNKELDKYNKEYLEDYRFIINESKPLTKTQEGVYLLVHFILLFIIPMILLEEFVTDPILSSIIFMTYMFCSPYISLFIQKYITNKIFKLIYKPK